MTNTTPEQVHISLKGESGVHDGGLYITWNTKKESKSNVYLWTDPKDKSEVVILKGSHKNYQYKHYTSGFIHVVAVDKKFLLEGKKMSFRCGDYGEDLVSEDNITLKKLTGRKSFSLSRTFVFSSVPKACLDCSVKLAIVGDLGQTEDSRKTMQHLSKSEAEVILHAGDLSYADGYQPRWDRYGKLMEKLAASRPYVTTAGNHEIEEWKGESFLSYYSRYPSPSPPGHVFYSFNTGSCHIILLNSYDRFDSDSLQYKWLENDFKTIDREQTLWIIVIMHAPWYNSNHDHHLEGEDMRIAMEPLFLKNKVDLVYSGHVHSYERTLKIADYKVSGDGIVYINIGDGGNREGLSKEFYRKPKWSYFREASFGHGMLHVQNSTHARFSWHRNQDSEIEISDYIAVGCQRITKKEECKNGCHWNEHMVHCDMDTPMKSETVTLLNADYPTTASNPLTQFQNNWNVEFSSLFAFVFVVLSIFLLWKGVYKRKLPGYSSL